jgi:hypothetical protein
MRDGDKEKPSGILASSHVWKFVFYYSYRLWAFIGLQQYYNVSMGASFHSKIYSKRILWGYYIIRNLQFYGTFLLIKFVGSFPKD